MEDATGDWIFMKDGCAGDEPEKPKGKCVGEITSKNADCEPIDNKEECESKGKGIMSDGYCDWIPAADDGACAKLTKCGECMDNMDCAYEMTKEKCMTAADMDEDDLRGDWAFMKESCPAPEDECNKPYTCEECMDNMECSYSKEKRMCKTAANLGMEDATGDWIFLKDGCADPKKPEGKCVGEITSKNADCEPIDNKEECESKGKGIMSDGYCDWIPDTDDDACAKLTKCGECMDNMDCAYEMIKKKCMTAADMDEDDLTGDWAFVKESCPAPEDECNKPYTCEECMDQEMCTYSKEKRMCKTAANLGMEDATGDWIFMKNGCAE